MKKSAYFWWQMYIDALKENVELEKKIKTLERKVKYLEKKLASYG